MKIRFFLFCFFASLAHLNCGGGSDMQQGTFVDSAVEGLSYETPSQSGQTDANGAFLFLPGESLRFFLGNVELGQAGGQEIVSPFDLVEGIEARTDAQSINRFFYGDQFLSRVTPFDRVLNLAIFSAKPGRRRRVGQWNQDSPASVRLACRRDASF